ncbi:MAG: hypothetical protein NTZ39_01855 [Methanoregula sp.]|nr:hypothetical protein [Methanoregula sp.]
MDIRVPHVTGDLLFGVPEKEPVALRAPLGLEMIPRAHGNSQHKVSLRPFGRRLLSVLFIRGDELHDLVGGYTHIDELFEDEVIEDQPREIGPVEDSFIFPERLIEILQGAATQRAFAADKLIEKNFFLAPRTGGVRGVHA